MNYFLNEYSAYEHLTNDKRVLKTASKESNFQTLWTDRR